MMEWHYDPIGEQEQSNHSWKIIRHHLYYPRPFPWFNLRVFYVRISNFEVDESTPEHLTLNHIPLGPDAILEVNGGRSGVCSECVSSLLRRDRVDKKTEEVTFVGTDSIKMTGNVRFEVCDKDGMLLSGALELCNGDGFTGESNLHGKKWRINCQPVMSAGSGFLKGKKYMGPETPLPVIEVYVAGCFSGTPIILTKTLQLVSWKKHDRKAGLDSIPEYDSTELKKDMPSDALKISEYRDYKSENDVDDDYYSILYSRREHTYREDDGELSWFNAGVRVGVGIGLGICLGVGLGVGLLARAYQATSGKFKRRLI